MKNRLGICSNSCYSMAKKPPNNPIIKGTKHLNRHFSQNKQTKKSIQKTNKYSVSLIRGIQSKTTRRYLLTPVRMAVIRETRNIKYSQRWREKGTLVHPWWEDKLVQLLGRTVWRFSLQRPRAAAELKPDRALRDWALSLGRKGCPVQPGIRIWVPIPLSLNSCRTSR